VNHKTIKVLKTATTCMVAIAILFAFLISGIRIFGVQVFGVLTGSMEPTYPTGSLIYVKAVDANQLRVNDVITFSLSPNVIATHRIVEVVPDENNPSIVRFRTKGDANNEVDSSLVSAGNIVGKVMFAVPRLGYVASYIQQPPGLYVAILICALMVGFVFYTDSLESGKKKTQENRSGVDVPGVLKRLGEIVLRKPAAKPQKPAAVESPVFRQGYVPQQQNGQPPIQTYGYQQTPQPFYGAQVPYQQPNTQPGYQYPPQPQQPYYQQPVPQQSYMPYQQPVRQLPQQPAYSQQQVYPQQPAYPQQQIYPQQPYAQVPYAPQPVQQPYPFEQNMNQTQNPQQRRSRLAERK